MAESKNVRCLGVDFGNVNIKCAFFDDFGRPALVKIDGDTLFPNAFYLEPDGKTAKVGHRALAAAVLHPERLVTCYKLQMRKEAKVKLSDVELPLAKVGALVLTRVREAAEQAYAAPVEHIVLTVPANFPDDARVAVIEAARQAGFTVRRCIREPSAGLLAYVHAHPEDTRKFVAAYDFGGGTFDVSIMVVQGTHIDVLSSAGVHVGGETFNDLLSELILKKVSDQAGRKIAVTDLDPLSRYESRKAVEAGKILLGGGDVTEQPFAVSHQGRHWTVTVMRSEFEQVVDAPIRQTLECFDRALAEAEGVSRVDYVVMLGGTSNMLLVQTRLQEHVGRDTLVKLEVNPEAAVALGALYHCATIVGEDPAVNVVGKGDKVIPESEVYMHETVTYGAGIIVRFNGQYVNEVILPKNYPQGGKPVTRSFPLEKDWQTHCLLDVVQGAQGAPLKDCTLIGRLEMNGLTPEAVRRPRIEVSFQTDDTTGLLHVKAKDSVSGVEAEATLDAKKE